MDVLPSSYTMDVLPSYYTMGVLLKKIHYNSEVFSAIVEDFEAFLAGTKPGTFYTSFGERAKTFPEANLICEEMTTDKMEEGLKELKKKPEIYFEDFYQVATILEDAHHEEKIEEWLDQHPCHLYIFYQTVMGILWSRNARRYTMALRDTGKAALL